MKALALVSGGKDSCFAVMEALRAGHDVVALGNLAPPSLHIHEMDSFTFQTVGHNVVALAYAQCCELPVFRTPLLRRSVVQSLDYSIHQDDEVEDLFQLVACAKSRIPEIEMVVSGAIASDYQRLRVENVCRRLSLVSLAPLWHRRQSELLEEMVASQLEAVLIKTASMGLVPAKHLGRSIRDLAPLFSKLEAAFGFNSCGEGGEYETLVLDCPFFKKRIVLTASRVVTDSHEQQPLIVNHDDFSAQVGHLEVDSLFLVDKKSNQQVLCTTAPALALETAVPADEDKRCADMLLLDSGENGWQLPHKTELLGEDFLGRSLSQARDNATATLRLPVFISSPLPVDVTTCADVPGADGLVRRTAACCVQCCSTSVAIETAAFMCLTQLLSLCGGSLQGVVYVEVDVPDMHQFSRVNNIYSKFFARPLPARACFQTQTTQLVFKALCLGRAVQRASTLHVESVSTWAPACIGPYAQAVLVTPLTTAAAPAPAPARAALEGKKIAQAEMLFLSGQIGMDPLHMCVSETARASLSLQLQQCMRNVQAVVESMRWCMDAVNDVEILLKQGADVSSLVPARCSSISAAAAAATPTSAEEISWNSILQLPPRCTVSIRHALVLPQDALVEVVWRGRLLRPNHDDLSL